MTATKISLTAVNATMILFVGSDLTAWMIRDGKIGDHHASLVAKR